MAESPTGTLVSTTTGFYRPVLACPDAPYTKAYVKPSIANRRNSKQIEGGLIPVVTSKPREAVEREAKCAMAGAGQNESK